MSPGAGNTTAVEHRLCFLALKTAVLLRYCHTCKKKKEKEVIAKLL